MLDSTREKINAVVPRLEGWASTEKAIAMAELITDIRPKVVVEIGVFGGRSLIPQALEIKELGCGHIFGIDPWRLSPVLEGNLHPADIKWWSNNVDLHEIHKNFMEALWREGLDAVATVLRCTAQQALPMFESIDVLHIDGNHTELASCRDVDGYLPKVRKGGMIWFDDTDWDTTQAALKKLHENCEQVKEVGTCALFRKRGELEQRVLHTAKRVKETAKEIVESQYV